MSDLSRRLLNLPPVIEERIYTFLVNNRGFVDVRATSEEEALVQLQEDQQYPLLVDVHVLLHN